MSIDNKMPPIGEPKDKSAVITEKTQIIKNRPESVVIGGEKSDIKKYLTGYLGLKEKDVEAIELLKAKDLEGNYKTQLEGLGDPRLESVTIAVIPDKLWIKGSQPSESNAFKQLITIKKSYFEDPENPDEIAWMIHELAHCQKFLDSESAESYKKDMQQFAFPDLAGEYSYPNNRVEQYTFTEQFIYLIRQKESQKKILEMIGRYYDDEDKPFFKKILAEIYNLYNIDEQRRIFESGTDDELLKLKRLFEFSQDQLDNFCHFAKLRRKMLDGMEASLIERKETNPKATKKEMNLGAYFEAIEPQVREAVLNLRRKGYSTYLSGFSGHGGQEIAFEKEYFANFKFQEAFIRELKEMGVIIKVEPDAIFLECKRALSIDELKVIWDKIEKNIPDLGREAEPCQLSQAVEFRKMREGK